jgi:hypothetical protein
MAGSAVMLAGSMVITISLGADVLGVGAAPGLGAYQIVGAVLGIIIAGVGLGLLLR